MHFHPPLQLAFRAHISAHVSTVFNSCQDNSTVKASHSGWVGYMFININFNYFYFSRDMDTCFINGTWPRHNVNKNVCSGIFLDCRKEWQPNLFTSFLSSLVFFFNMIASFLIGFHFFNCQTTMFLKG